MTIRVPVEEVIFQWVKSCWWADWVTQAVPAPCAHWQAVGLELWMRGGSFLIIVSAFLSSPLLPLKGLCPWCLCLFCPTSVTPPCWAPRRLTSQTSGRPGSASEAPGSTRSSGPFRPSWVGAATGPRDPAPRAPSSGTSVHPPASHTFCVCSSSVCCCPFYSWSTLMAESWLQSGGWVHTNLLSQVSWVVEVFENY